MDSPRMQSMVRWVDLCLGITECLQHPITKNITGFIGLRYDHWFIRASHQALDLEQLKVDLILDCSMW